MNETKHIISFSGGKDSTALLLMMLEKNMKIDDIIHADTGMEFPKLYEHIEKVEKYIGLKITRVRAKYGFEYLLGEIPRTNKSKYTHDGRGWADMRVRWCTSELKTYPINRYIKKKYENNIIQYVGIAKDEEHRANNYKTKLNIKYPLVDWNITEKQALEYCYDKGFDWGGLYKLFKRVSCYCCPLQSLNELRVIYNEYPNLWKDMLRMDKKSWRSFRQDYTLQQLNDKFKSEITLFEEAQNVL